MSGNSNQTGREKLPFEVKTVEDFYRLREIWSEGTKTPKVLASSAEAPSLDFPGQDTRLLLSGEESAGYMAIFELTIHPGFGAPNHHQRNEDEFWYVLEGEIDITIDDQSRVVKAGASAYAPKGCKHSFFNSGDKPVRMLTMNGPAGHERFFEALNAASQVDDRRPIMEAHDVVFHEKVVFDN